MAGSGEVTMVFTADEAKAWAAIQKLAGATAKLKSGLDGIGQSGKGANDTVKKLGDSHVKLSAGAQTMTRMVANVAGLATGYLSLSSAISSVTDDLKRQEQAAIATAQANLAVGRAQAETIKNLAGLTSAEKISTINNDVTAIQSSTGFGDRAALTQAFGAGYSASGDIAATKSAVETSARVNLANPAGLSGSVTSLLDIAKATGNKDAAENLSFVLQAGAMNRAEDPNKVAANLAPVVTAAVAGAPKQNPKQAASEAAAVFGVLSGLGADRFGDSSGTASTQLLSKINQLYSKTGDRDPGTILGRIKDLQSSPGMQKKLFKDEFGDARYKQAFKSILTEGSEAAKQLDAAAQGITFDKSEYNKLLVEQRLTPQMRLTTSEAKLGGVKDELAAKDQTSAKRGILAAEIPKILDATMPTDRPVLRRMLEGSSEFASWATQDTEKHYSRMLNIRERELIANAQRRGLMQGEDESSLPADVAAKLQTVRRTRGMIGDMFAQSSAASPETQMQLMQAAKDMSSAAADMKASAASLNRASNPDYSARAEAERRQAEGR